MVTTIANENITVCSKEWATRPDDQRFLSLDDLYEAVSRRKRESWTATPLCNELRVIPQEGGLALNVLDPTADERKTLELSNWSFNQLSQYAGAPGKYLRTLPAELAAINLQWGLENSPVRDNTLVLGQTNGHNSLRSMTSVSYGRIWDKEVVEAVMKVNADNRWTIPAASYTTSNPKRATTLYASDRDVFIFLVDAQNEIEIDGEKLYRGFYCWNSEVGAQVFGLTTFLYRYVCDNRIIWGATDVKEIRIRHTRGAPERFAYEGSRYLKRYAEESTQKLIEGVKQAKNTELPITNTETVSSWLQDRGFTKAQANSSVDYAMSEEGQARTFWDVVNGITAYARSITHTDERVDLEQKAGKLMEMATR